VKVDNFCRIETEYEMMKGNGTMIDLTPNLPRLSGIPVVGAFEGERTGHDMNHRLVKALLADASAWCIEELQEDTLAASQETGEAVAQAI